MSEKTFYYLILLSIPILLLIYYRLRLKRLKIYHSPILGRVEVFEKYNHELVLTTNSYIQGISTNLPSVSKSYWYKIAEIAVNQVKKIKKPQVLILGLGANTTSSLIAQMRPHIHQTIVEIEPLVTKVCQEFFNLKQLKNLTLIETDAYKLIEAGVDKKSKITLGKYDIIVVDIFLAVHPYLDLKSNRHQFIEKLITYLKPDGMIIFNRHGHTKAIRQEGHLLEDYLKTLFNQTQFIDIKDPRGFRNNVITAQSRLGFKKVHSA